MIARRFLPNQSVQPTGGSRFAQPVRQHQRRLPPVADAGRFDLTAMTPEEKRALKKQGKALVEKRSAAWAAALQRSNPARIGSDEWMNNHLKVRENESWLASKQRDHITAAEVAQRFVLIEGVRPEKS